MQAFLAHPERFNHKQPQLKTLPESVYINPPKSTGIDAYTIQPLQLGALKMLVNWSK